VTGVRCAWAVTTARDYGGLLRWHFRVASKSDRLGSYREFDGSRANVEGVSGLLRVAGHAGGIRLSWSSAISAIVPFQINECISRWKVEKS